MVGFVLKALSKSLRRSAVGLTVIAAKNVKGTGSLTQYATRVLITCINLINILTGGSATCLLSGEKIDYRNAAKREARISCKPLYFAAKPS